MLNCILTTVSHSLKEDNNLSFGFFSFWTTHWKLENLNWAIIFNVCLERSNPIPDESAINVPRSITKDENLLLNILHLGISIEIYFLLFLLFYVLSEIFCKSMVITSGEVGSNLKHSCSTAETQSDLVRYNNSRNWFLWRR